MKTLLQIRSSIFSDGGQSSQLAEHFVNQWLEDNPAGTLVVRDLANDPVPHLTAARFGSFLAKAADRTAEQQAVATYSDDLINEIKGADEIVLALPMYNFGIPSTLKAYFDHIARAGETFMYTANGPVGLVTGKRVHVFATRGGVYLGTPLDTQTSYIRAFLGFLGMSDIEFIYAEGLAMGDESKAAALAKARAEITARAPLLAA